MKKDIYIALIDSGCSFDTFEKLAIKVINEEISITTQDKINHLHGDTIAKIMQGDNIKLYDIQIFDKNLTTSPLHLHGALNYLLEKEVDIISLSLGLKTNYKEIEEVCNKLIGKGVTIVASFPRSSEYEIYPASYEGVIKVTADGMCEDINISIIDKDIFGANPHSHIKGISGSSIAVAKFIKKYSSYLTSGYKKDEILTKIRSKYEQR